MYMFKASRHFDTFNQNILIEMSGREVIRSLRKIIGESEWLLTDAERDEINILIIEFKFLDIFLMLHNLTGECNSLLIYSKIQEFLSLVEERGYSHLSRAFVVPMLQKLIRFCNSDMEGDYSYCEVVTKVQAEVAEPEVVNKFLRDVLVTLDYVCSIRPQIQEDIQYGLQSLGFLCLLLGYRNSSQIAFFKHVIAVAGEAAMIISLDLTVFVSREEGEVCNCLLNDLVSRRILPIQPCVRQMYVEALESFKSGLSSSSSSASQLVATQCTFAVFLRNNLIMLQSSYRKGLTINCQEDENEIPTLLEMLKFLGTNLERLPSQGLGSHLREMEDVMINVALFIFSLYDNEDEAIGEVTALDFPSMIQRVSAVISQAIRFSLQSVLPKIDGLGFIDFLLDNMKEFLISRYLDSIPSAKNQLEAVLKELESVQPFIKDVVAGKCLEHDRFKHLAALVIGKAYEIEYIVDCYMTKDVPGWCLTPWLSDIIEEIEFVTAEVKKIQGNICNSRADNVDDVTNGCTSSLLASTPSIAEEMVGFEDVVQILGNQLVSGKPAQLDVISLVGYNGQGKTTVANKLFTDELVVSLFDVRARCFVSEVYERRELLVAILNDVLSKPIDDLSEVHEDEIADKLHKLLSPKRYLMLIDNVNDPIAWDFLKSCFPDVNNGSRIILTTRLDEVANYARGVSPPHHLRLFSDEESWMLLQHKVFPNKSCPPVLRPYIQRLAKECNGLPFHVVILASGLARMSNKELELLAKGNEGALMVFYEELMKKVREVFANRVCVSQPENISNVSGYYRSCLLAAESISEEMVGFKDVMQQITRQLVRGTPKRDVISIVGMAGQGKTTLANSLFIDITVVSQFDVRAKCHVSQVYERRELLVAILSDVVDKPTDYSEVAEDELADKLRRLLLSKRYLILIDDVWETRAWDELQLCFPDANNGSRIILTSRLDIVANYARCVTSPHHLRLFSDEESWMLLQKKVFLQRSCPPDLEGIGKEIAKKCGRLPLSVVLVAGVVASMMKKEQWEQVADNLASLILGDSKQIIQFSYKDLPHHLKPCFLYFGAFLEDKEIQISKLMKLWIAEGFVVKQKEKCLADLAEDYLEDLIRRNLVMATKKGYFGKVKACRIHDLLLGFCKEKAKEENFLLQMYRDQDENSANMLSQMIIQRRLSVYSKQHNLVDESPSCSSVHSILFRNLGDGVVPSIESLSSFSFHRFKCLRVLDLEFVTIDSFPTNLSSHLRYLALRTVEESIPSSIANLQNLETLVVKGLRNELSLPHSLCKMVKMRHLHLKDRASFDLQNLKLFLEDPSQLENLESFSTPAFSCGEDVLRKTPNLQKLRCIWGFPEDCNQFPELQHLTKLESLKVFCFHGPERRSPNCELNFPSHLKKLTLCGFKLPWSEISAISKLGKLEILKLQCDAFCGEEWEVTDDQFFQLKVLKLQNLSFKQWRISEDAFSNLEQLFLHSCDSLVEFPSEFGYISGLQSVEIKLCHESVVNLARDVEEVQVEEMQNIGFKLSAS